MYPVAARSCMISIAFSPSLPTTAGSSCSLPSRISFAEPGAAAGRAPAASTASCVCCDIAILLEGGVSRPPALRRPPQTILDLGGEDSKEDLGPLRPVGPVLDIRRAASRHPPLNAPA